MCPGHAAEHPRHGRVGAQCLVDAHAQFGAQRRGGVGIVVEREAAAVLVIARHVDGLRLEGGIGGEPQLLARRETVARLDAARQVAGIEIGVELLGAVDAHPALRRHAVPGIGRGEREIGGAKMLRAIGTELEEGAVARAEVAVEVPIGLAPGNGDADAGLVCHVIVPPGGYAADIGVSVVAALGGGAWKVRSTAIDATPQRPAAGSGRCVGGGHHAGVDGGGSLLACAEGGRTLAAAAEQQVEERGGRPLNGVDAARGADLAGDLGERRGELVAGEVVEAGDWPGQGAAAVIILIERRGDIALVLVKVRAQSEFGIEQNVGRSRVVAQGCREIVHDAGDDELIEGARDDSGGDHVIAAGGEVRRDDVRFQRAVQRCRAGKGDGHWIGVRNVHAEGGAVKHREVPAADRAAFADAQRAGATDADVAAGDAAAIACLQKAVRRQYPDRDVARSEARSGAGDLERVARVTRDQADEGALALVHELDSCAIFDIEAIVGRSVQKAAIADTQRAGEFPARAVTVDGGCVAAGDLLRVRTAADAGIAGVELALVFDDKGIVIAAEANVERLCRVDGERGPRAGNGDGVAVGACLGADPHVVARCHRGAALDAERVAVAAEPDVEVGGGGDRCPVLGGDRVAVGTITDDQATRGGELGGGAVNGRLVAGGAREAAKPQAARRDFTRAADRQRVAGALVAQREIAGVGPGAGHGGGISIRGGTDAEGSRVAAERATGVDCKSLRRVV